MQSKATTPEQYLAELPEDRKQAMLKLRNAIKDNLPKGFEEVISYGMLGFVVPHSIYPAGYHCTPKLPLPFINLASQKNFIALYHMGIYGDKNLLDWFVTEYSKCAKNKIDTGKGCLRFKKLDDIPFELIGELATKISVEDWITMYEYNWKSRTK
ncbi:DUF1801 domain-containing protein [Flavobacterium paronense]|uniref:DUF1801 domain-containing protein n=1 Tax=Flavobacterium paronense TaxID=1392775 RepID=A0ABV5GBW2_9FLAO|nr:DUF1801 domain-containing protein [Flavobacterium paronense]MDN3677768.1 DUF1801 domain-containing protein [Flavobacterium paronense]